MLVNQISLNDFKHWFYFTPTTAIFCTSRIQTLEKFCLLHVSGVLVRVIEWVWVSWWVLLEDCGWRLLLPTRDTVVGLASTLTDHQIQRKRGREVIIGEVM